MPVPARASSAALDSSAAGAVSESGPDHNARGGMACTTLVHSMKVPSRLRTANVLVPVRTTPTTRLAAAALMFAALASCHTGRSQTFRVPDCSKSPGGLPREGTGQLASLAELANSHPHALGITWLMFRTARSAAQVVADTAGYMPDQVMAVLPWNQGTYAKIVVPLSGTSTIHSPS
jgi:hypothetical protein